MYNPSSNPLPYLEGNPDLESITKIDHFNTALLHLPYRKDIPRKILDGGSEICVYFPAFIGVQTRIRDYNLFCKVGEPRILIHKATTSWEHGLIIPHGIKEYVIGSKVDEQKVIDAINTVLEEEEERIDEFKKIAMEVRELHQKHLG